MIIQFYKSGGVLLLRKMCSLFVGMISWLWLKCIIGLMATLQTNQVLVLEISTEVHCSLVAICKTILSFGPKSSAIIFNFPTVYRSKYYLR